MYMLTDAMDEMVFKSYLVGDSYSLREMLEKTFPKPRFGFKIFWSLQMVQMRLILILFTICHGLLVAKVFRDFIDP